MIHTIIYANRNGGYNFFERSDGFPPEFEEPIRSISGYADSQAPDLGSQAAIRYAPLMDRFLLSVIFRIVGGNADHNRAHTIIVHFLMEQQEANRFFSLPFCTGAENAIQTARDLLEQYRDTCLPAQLDSLFLPPSVDAPPPADMEAPAGTVLSGALYCARTPASSQLFLQYRNSPYGDLQNLLKSLPYYLRKRISFHTCVLSASESQGTCINFCPPPRLEVIASGSFDGSAPTNKYCWYPDESGIPAQPDREAIRTAAKLSALPEKLPLMRYLQYTIWSWEDYLALSDLARSSRPLEDALEIIPQDRLLSLLRQENKLTPAELKQLGSGARRGSELDRQIRRQLRNQQKRESRENPSRNQPDAGGTGRKLTAMDLLCFLIGIVLLILSAANAIQDIGKVLESAQNVSQSVSSLLALLKTILVAVSAALVGFFGRGLLDKILS